jgi:hypothetical protein
MVAPKAMPCTDIVLDIEEGIEFDKPQYHLPRAESFVFVQVIRSTCLTPLACQANQIIVR